MATFRFFFNLFAGLLIFLSIRLFTGYHVPLIPCLVATVLYAISAWIGERSLHNSLVVEMNRTLGWMEVRFQVIQKDLWKLINS